LDAISILNDDYPSELSGTYWMLNALETLGRRNSEIWMELQVGVTATIYEDSTGQVYAMIWNPSSSAKVIDFYDVEGFVISKEVAAYSFTKVGL